MVGQPAIGAARRRWSARNQSGVGRRSVRHGHAIRHAGTAHAGGSRIKIPRLRALGSRPSTRAPYGRHPVLSQRANGIAVDVVIVISVGAGC